MAAEQDRQDYELARDKALAIVRLLKGTPACVAYNAMAMAVEGLLVEAGEVDRGVAAAWLDIFCKKVMDGLNDNYWAREGEARQ